MIETHDTFYESGDVLIRPKGLLEHVGICLGNGQVLHNTPNEGVHISSVDEFADGKLLSIRKTPPYLRNHVLKNAYNMLSAHQEYNLLFNNCEHTVTSATEEKAHSNQLLFWGFVAVSVALIAIAFRRQLFAR